MCMPFRFWPCGKGAPCGPVPRPACAQTACCMVPASNSSTIAASTRCRILAFGVFVSSRPIVTNLHLVSAGSQASGLENPSSVLVFSSQVYALAWRMATGRAGNTERVRDTEVGECEHPIRAATGCPLGRERLRARVSGYRSLTVAALSGVLATSGFVRLADIYVHPSLPGRAPGGAASVIGCSRAADANPAS